MGDMVVLYRAHYHALELQLMLARERIPFVITSGMRFFEQAHIKDACSILRLLANPGDELAYSRLLGLFPKMGKKTCAKLWVRAGATPRPARFRPARAAGRHAARGRPPDVAGPASGVGKADRQARRPH
jgi:DNA helicase-2/ATP-dependent DNA helicase PcrA